MVRAAVDRASRCAAVICDCVLQEAASAARGNIVPVKVRNNNKALGMIAGLNSTVAAFRGLHLAGEPQSFAGLLNLSLIHISMARAVFFGSAFQDKKECDEHLCSPSVRGCNSRPTL